MRVTGGLLCVGLLLTGLVLVSCSGGDAEQQTAQPNVEAEAGKVGLGFIGSLGDIVSLDDPGNPYAGEYEEWDQWIYDNRVGISQGPTNTFIKLRKEDEYVMPAYVDGEGYLLPYRRFVELHEESSKRDYTASVGKDRTHVYAVGEMSDELTEGAWQAAWEVKANYFEPVPDWLVENPPVRANLLPNGEVIAYGKLGSGLCKPDVAQTPGDCDDCGHGHYEDMDYYRYSANGDLLGQTAEFWFELYYDFDQPGAPRGNMERRTDGYVIFRDSLLGVEVVFDYDGTKLGLTDVPLARDPHPYKGLTAVQLIRLNFAQSTVGAE